MTKGGGGAENDIIFLRPNVLEYPNEKLAIIHKN